MLRELAIKDFALIDDVTIPFEPGLTALTGETGAGKSILAGALSAVCGARASDEWIREGAPCARLSAAFQLPEGHSLLADLADKGIEVDGGELVLRREVARNGRGRAWINGAAVVLGELRRVGERLVDFHGQHESTTLLAPARHLEILDEFAGQRASREAVARAYDERARARGALDSERRRIDSIREGRELLERELAEIDAVNPGPMEEETLEQERRALAHGSKLVALLERAEAELSGDGGAAERADRAARALRDATVLDERLRETAALVDSALVEITEAAAHVARVRRGLIDSEGRVDAVIERIEKIARLRKRYGGSIENIIARREAIAGDLALAAGAEDRLDDLARDLAALDSALAQRATALSAARRASAKTLSTRVAAELADLGMRGAAFSVEVARAAPDGDDAEGRLFWTTRTGVDSVEFFLSPNAGEGRHPLARIASGGELSRVLLALETALGDRRPARVSVFDEVDAGVGADMAAAIGAKLRAASQERQVLVITHFAQVAALADAHVRVAKQARAGRTRIVAERLVHDERGREVARMLGDEGEIARRHADEILAAGERGAGGRATPERPARGRVAR